MSPPAWRSEHSLDFASRVVLLVGWKRLGFPFGAVASARRRTAHHGIRACAGRETRWTVQGNRAVPRGCVWTRLAARARASRSRLALTSTEENDDTSCHLARRPSGARRLLTRSSVRFPSPPLSTHDPQRRSAREARRSARSSTRCPTRPSGGSAPLLETRARFPGRRTRKRTAWSRRAWAVRARPRPRDPGVPRRDQAPRGDRSRRARARDLERHADPPRRRLGGGEGEARGDHGAARLQHAARE